MRIVITGGAGMIGSHLVDALLDGGTRSSSSTISSPDVARISPTRRISPGACRRGRYLGSIESPGDCRAGRLRSPSVGWKPETDLTTGLERTLAYFREEAALSCSGGVASLNDPGVNRAALHPAYRGAQYQGTRSVARYRSRRKNAVHLPSRIQCSRITCSNAAHAVPTPSSVRIRRPTSAARRA